MNNVYIISNLARNKEIKKQAVIYFALFYFFIILSQSHLLNSGSSSVVLRYQSDSGPDVFPSLWKAFGSLFTSAVSAG